MCLCAQCAACVAREGGRRRVSAVAGFPGGTALDTSVCVFLHERYSVRGLSWGTEPWFTIVERNDL